MSLDLSALWGGDHSIYQTVGEIKRLVYRALRDPFQRIRRRAESVLSPVQERNEIQEVKGLFSWVQNHFHYLHDPIHLEYIKPPEQIDDEIWQRGFFSGDCDDATAYLAALLSSIGYPVKLAVVAPEKKEGFLYKHIYLKVWLERRKLWVSLDLTAKGKPFGWEVPYKRISEYAL